MISNKKLQQVRDKDQVGVTSTASPMVPRVAQDVPPKPPRGNIDLDLDLFKLMELIPQKPPRQHRFRFRFRFIQTTGTTPSKTN